MSEGQPKGLNLKTVFIISAILSGHTLGSS